MLLLTLQIQKEQVHTVKHWQFTCTFKLRCLMNHNLKYKQLIEIITELWDLILSICHPWLHWSREPEHVKGHLHVMCRCHHLRACECTSCPCRARSG